jgi:hypothetical protein
VSLRQGGYSLENVSLENVCSGYLSSTLAIS